MYIYHGEFNNCSSKLMKEWFSTAIGKKNCKSSLWWTLCSNVTQQIISMATMAYKAYRYISGQLLNYFENC